MEKLVPGILSIRWQDAVDILFGSYFLFRLYVLFKGTNVFRVLMGIAFLWFVQRMASSLGLIVTSWGIQGITAGATLIIIVIFRNEIRSVLQATNLKAILWGFPKKGRDTPVQVIVESAFELARKHAGALIVLPGREDLSELVHSGKAWHGLLSRDMIMSIFWPDNPVHDGAAIVEGAQVTEVGAILPVSQRKELPSHYGTRHRAAAGLAENTDALVIVISEARGEVTVAKGSDVSLVTTQARLTQMLQEHTGIERKNRGYVGKENLKLVTAAFVSVLFIAGIWFSFTRGIDTMITLEIPIEYLNRNPGMEILDTSVTTVHLDLSGSGALIKSVQPEQVRLRLDLSGAAVGMTSFTITPENITLPPGILLKNVEPSVVDVTLDVPAKKELPVQVDWVGSLPEDFVMSGATLDPEKVQVIGGSRILKETSTIYTEKVSVDNMKRTGAISVKLALNPASLKIAPDSKDRVTVQYVLKKRE